MLLDFSDILQVGDIYWLFEVINGCYDNHSLMHVVVVLKKWFYLVIQQIDVFTLGRAYLKLAQELYINLPAIGRCTHTDTLW